MTCKYSVTFEFDARQPLTHTGTVTAGAANTALFRAVREAQKALTPKGWTSVVAVLLERA